MVSASELKKKVINENTKESVDAPGGKKWVHGLMRVLDKVEHVAIKLTYLAVVFACASVLFGCKESTVEPTPAPAEKCDGVNIADVAGMATEYFASPAPTCTTCVNDLIVDSGATFPSPCNGATLTMDTACECLADIAVDDCQATNTSDSSICTGYSTACSGVTLSAVGVASLTVADIMKVTGNSATDTCQLCMQLALMVQMAPDWRGPSNSCSGLEDEAKNNCDLTALTCP